MVGPNTCMVNLCTEVVEQNEQVNKVKAQVADATRESKFRKTKGQVEELPAGGIVANHLDEKQVTDVKMIALVQVGKGKKTLKKTDDPLPELGFGPKPETV